MDYWYMFLQNLTFFFKLTMEVEICIVGDSNISKTAIH